MVCRIPSEGSVPSCSAMYWAIAAVQIFSAMNVTSKPTLYLFLSSGSFFSAITFSFSSLYFSVHISSTLASETNEWSIPYFWTKIEFNHILPVFNAYVHHVFLGNIGKIREERIIFCL